VVSNEQQLPSKKRPRRARGAPRPWLALAWAAVVAGLWLAWAGSLLFRRAEPTDHQPALPPLARLAQVTHYTITTSVDDLHDKQTSLTLPSSALRCVHTWTNHERRPCASE
jgi:hypothetical protein